MDSLCFFFNNYVNLPREPQSNIFIEHVMPLWQKAPENSPLKYATSATAANLSNLWRQNGPDSDLARSKYGQALLSLREAFKDPDMYNDDNILGTMFMLDFYESLNSRYESVIDMDTHQKAAMALVSSRGGRHAFQSESSRRLFTALRTRYIIFNLQNKRRIDLDDDLLQEDPEMDLPASKLDLILAQLANAMHSSRHLIDTGAAPSGNSDPLDYEMTFELLLSALLEINLRLNAWLQNLPASWEPYRILDAAQSLHYSIRAVGLYNDYCDVYTSTATAHHRNSWRSTKVHVLNLIKHCLKHVPTDSFSRFIMPGDVIDIEIQTLVDDICASIPFHLGSRTTLSLPHEHQEYPPVPPQIRSSANYVDSSGRPTTFSDNDHIRSAAAIGGWFLLAPLGAIMQRAKPLPPENDSIDTDFRLEPINLRPGQIGWILGQIRRIHKIYKIPMPAMGGRSGGPPSNGAKPSPVNGNGTMPGKAWQGGAQSQKAEPPAVNGAMPWGSLPQRPVMDTKRTNGWSMPLTMS